MCASRLHVEELKHDQILHVHPADWLVVFVEDQQVVDAVLAEDA
jgi:hypothetical protein